MIATLSLTREFKNESKDNLENIKKKIIVPISPYLKKKSKKSKSQKRGQKSGKSPAKVLQKSIKSQSKVTQTSKKNKKSQKHPEKSQTDFLRPEFRHREMRPPGMPCCPINMRAAPPATRP